MSTSLMDRMQALVIRTAGVLAAIGMLSRVALLGPAGALDEVEILLHAGTILVSAVVALLAHPRQTHGALRTLAAVLLGTITIMAGAMLAWDGTDAWRLGAVFMAVALAGPFIGAWSWRWQAGLAGGVVAVAAAALVWNGAVTLSAAADMVLIVAAAGGASVVGAHLVHASLTQLGASEARYRALFRAAGDAIVVLDRDGIIRETNDAFDRLIGGAPGRAVGSHGTEQMTPMQPGHQPLARTFADALHLALAGTAVATVGRLRTAAGDAVDVDIRLAPVPAPSGRHVQATLRDRSTEQQLARQAEREARMEAVRRLAGGVAHEFNTVLGTIRNLATMLRDDAASGEQRLQLEEIIDTTARGGDLARELLQFGQQHALTTVRTDPAQLLSSGEVLARAALLDGVRVEVEVPAGLPPVLADRDALLHAILQIALNARDATDDVGTFTMSAAAVTVQEGEEEWRDVSPGPYVRFSFRDTGRGMDREVLDRVFEPFFSTRPQWAARGTGLSVVHGVARAHRGAVRLQSWPGRGTVVHLLVPVWQAAEPPSPAAGPPALRRATVLVGDDDENFRGTVGRALQRAGYTVVEAGSAREVMDRYLATTPRPDMVILDYIMPEGGGPAAFEALRAERADLPILFCTGYAPVQDNRLARLAAQKDVVLLRKPFDLADLYRDVAFLLGETD